MDESLLCVNNAYVDLEYPRALAVLNLCDIEISGLSTYPKMPLTDMLSSND